MTVPPITIKTAPTGMAAVSRTTPLYIHVACTTPSAVVKGCFFF